MDRYELTPEAWASIKAFFSNRLVQLVLALTWARIFFPSWVEAVGTEVVLRIMGVS